MFIVTVARGPAAEFRHRIIELIQTGKTPEELARKFEPTAQTIRNWIAQADRDAGRRQDVDGLRR